MKSRPPFLLFPFSFVNADPDLDASGPGYRKQLVTELHPDVEYEAKNVRWHPPDDQKKCPILHMENSEVAVFNHRAHQDRHYHKQGTEIYILVEGQMTICIGGIDHRMFAGDMVVINPGTIHKVQSSDKPFLCRVINVNCGGKADKYVVDDPITPS